MRVSLPTITVWQALTVIAFFLIGFAVFGSTLRSDFVTWDDGGLISENPNVKAMNAKTLQDVFTSYDPELYIPLTFVSYQIDHVIGGDDPAVYHATNLLLHILNALLVVLLLSSLFGSGLHAVGLGLLFLVHPLNAEAVAWASARKDVLSTFFFLGSLLLYLRYRGSTSGAAFAGSLILYVLGLLAKVMVVTLPVVLCLLDLLEGRKDYRRIVKEKLPYIALAILFGVIAIFGKTTVLAASTLWHKLLMAGKSTVFYVQKFILPYGLSFAYPYTEPIRLSSPDFFIPIAVLISIVAVLYRYRRQSPLILFGLSFYVTTLIPTFTNFSKGNDIYFASDRYAYIPMIGLLIVLGQFSESWLSSASTVRLASRRRTIIGVAFGAVLIVFASLAHAQALTWKDSETLYRHALKYYPNSRAAHHNLGMEMLQKGNPEGAIIEFDTAGQIKDDPRTRVSRGAALVSQKRFAEATVEYQTVIGMDPDQPDAYYGLGNIAYKLGNLPEAVVQYRKALAVKPDYANALNNIGAVYLELKDWENAIEALRQSVEIRPDFPESYYNLAGAEERAGLMREAEDDYRRAIELSPGDADALAALASLLYNQKRIPEAADLLKSALRIQESNTIGLQLLERMHRDGIVR